MRKSNEAMEQQSMNAKNCPISDTLINLVVEQESPVHVECGFAKPESGGHRINLLPAKSIKCKKLQVQVNTHTHTRTHAHHTHLHTHSYVHKSIHTSTHTHTHIHSLSHPHSHKQLLLPRTHVPTHATHATRARTATTTIMHHR